MELPLDSQSTKFVIDTKTAKTMNIVDSLITASDLASGFIMFAVVRRRYVKEKQAKLFSAKISDINRLLFQRESISFCPNVNPANGCIQLSFYTKFDVGHFPSFIGSFDNCRDIGRTFDSKNLYMRNTKDMKIEAVYTFTNVYVNVHRVIYSLR